MPMAAAFAESHNHPPNYVAVCRRPPRTMRRTATAVLAGGFGWYNPPDLFSLRTDPPTPSPALSVSAVLPAAPPRDATADHLVSDSASRRNASVQPPRGGARAKAKAKTPGPSRPIDTGVSIIPICAPGTGTPSPSPSPESASPLDHPHSGRPPHSYASSSSSLSFSFAIDRAISVARRSDFDPGAPRTAGDAAAATVGKRSRGPSQSQRTRLPISPPVTSPNTSQSELPGTAPPMALSAAATTPALPGKPKRAREGREAGRRKRRKTGRTRGDSIPGVASAPSLDSHEHVDAAAVRSSPPPVAKQPREPPRRKGWKGWVMVSDTEGSDTERPNTPPVVILEKRTRSGRDFDQDATRLPRRARSRASTRSTRTDSVAPPSSGIAT